MYLTDVPVIEDLRHRFNPVQARLIPAHVTLCREDEVSDWRAFEHRLKEVCPIHVTLEFGRPVRDGHLVLIPAISGIETFDALRFSF